MESLNWNATLRGWVGHLEDGSSVFVPEDVYEQYFNEYLTQQGMVRKSWMQIKQAAEEEWQRQCEAEKQFQATIENWLKDCGKMCRIMKLRKFW